MDEKFLLKAIVEEVPQDQTVLVVKPEEINFNEIHILHLEYRSEEIIIIIIIKSVHEFVLGLGM